MPLTFEQEKKYLELGINESLIKVFLIDSETHWGVSNYAITDRCSSEPDVGEPADYGFSLLFKHAYKVHPWA